MAQVKRKCQFCGEKFDAAEFSIKKYCSSKCRLKIWAVRHIKEIKKELHQKNKGVR